MAEGPRHAVPSRLDVVLDAVADAVTVHDASGRTVYVNDAAVRLLGASSREEVLDAETGQLAERFEITREDGAPVRPEDFPGRHAVAGEPAPPLLTRSVSRSTGRVYWLLTKATVVHEPDGRVLAVNVIEDVTEAKEAEQAQRIASDTLQRSLLPARLPEVPGWRCAGWYQAGSPDADVGGDFYDLFAAGDEHVALLGDVTGKGVEAAALTALARHTARTGALFDSRPSAVLALLDRILRDQPAPALVTVVCARLERSGMVTVSSGGHPLPLRAPAAGGAAPVGVHGLLLGAVPGAEWTECPIRMVPGDTLLLYSDGVTDTPGREERFGEQRLARLVADAPRPPAALLETVAGALHAFQVGATVDDRAMLAVQYAPE